MGFLSVLWDDFSSGFYQNFIYKDRWKYLTGGLKNSVIITLLALVLGMALGFMIALVRVTHDNTGKLRFPNRLAKLYLSVIRGTPALIQLMIIYYVVFATVNISKTAVAAISFGINSGAYAAEIFRGGIMSVDKGQGEAGRSLGLSYSLTMRTIIMPQAMKNSLPALGNELITLLKETSIAGYIAISDLTKGADIIRSQTYSAFMPLLAVALIYLCLVLLLEFILGKLEQRLRRGDSR